MCPHPTHVQMRSFKEISLDGWGAMAEWLQGGRRSEALGRIEREGKWFRVAPLRDQGTCKPCRPCHPAQCSTKQGKMRAHCEFCHLWHLVSSGNRTATGTRDRCQQPMVRHDELDSQCAPRCSTPRPQVQESIEDMSKSVVIRFSL